ncbi:MAG TPA: hypothetical protein VHD88_03210 [Pyrinomonadaceae bacterium]|nr:hypothetical protein [Pyrinomonadaceae bacterium]
MLLSVIHSAAYSQSGRVKRPAQKPTIVTPVPVDTSSSRPKKVRPAENVDGERICVGKELDSKAIILKKPTPGDTREARRHSFRGTVVLQAILAANGEVTHITVISRLPYGLTEKAIEAAP